MTGAALSCSTPPVSAWARGATTFTARRLVVIGLLWAAAQTAVNSYGLPVEALSATELLHVLFEVYVSFALQGVCGAFFAEHVAAHFSIPTLALAILLLAFGVPGVRFILETSLPLPDLPLFAGRSLWTAYIYDAWTSLWSGALFMLGCVFGLRSEHTRLLLGQAEIARGQTEAVLSEVELQNLRGHIDPTLLLRVMAEVQRRYSTDSARADRLLEQLVNFLRRAMPGVRTGTSTLAAEVKLARALARLLADVDPQHPTWRIRVESGLEDVPFPPLLLLPVLDALAAAAPPASTCALTLGRLHDPGPPTGAATIALRLDAPVIVPRWLPEALEHRLRVGLAAVFGRDWSLQFRDPRTAHAPALVLTLNSPAPPGIASQTRPSTTDLETQDG